MADNIRFLSGNEQSLPTTVVNGQVYFAITDKDMAKGKILFDKDNIRYTMAGASTISGFGICSTPSNEAQKIIVLTDDSRDWEPQAGSILNVFFENTNTSMNPTFQITKTFNETTTTVIKDAQIVYKSASLSDSNLMKAGAGGYILSYIFYNDKFQYLSGYGDESLGRFENQSSRDFIVGQLKIYAHNLVGLNESGLFVPANREKFLIGAPLYVTETALNADDVNSNQKLHERGTYILLHDDMVELDAPCSQAPVYLKGIVNGIYFMPDFIEPFVYSLPEEDTKNQYLYIGEICAFLSEANKFTYINLNFSHPIYQVKNGEKELYGTSLNHSLTIGEQSFDGSKDVTVPIYDGEIIVIN